MSTQPGRGNAAPFDSVKRLFRAGQYDQVEKACHSILRVDANNRDAKYYLALSLYKRRRLLEAERIFRELIRRNPRDEASMYGLGRALEELGRLAEAVAVIQSLVQLNPTNVKVETKLGQMQARLAQSNAGPGSPGTSQRTRQHDPLRRIVNEKKKADKAVSTGLGKIWPWIALLGGPTVNGLIAPAVAEQRTFFGVFLSTLAFSSGVAAFYFIVATKAFGDIGGIQYAIVCTVCLFLGSLMAIGVGYGFYEVPIPYGKYGGTPVGWVMPFVDAAINTFGPLGAYLGALSGCLAGHWGYVTHEAVNRP